MASPTNLDRLRSLINDEAARHRQPLSSHAADAIVRYLELLERWGRTLRLVGHRSIELVVTRHLGDAFVMSNVLDQLDQPLQSAIDVGSGGGLPGLPLAIVRPKLRITLVEANTRKASFLTTAVHQLGLNCEVRAQRVEQLISTRQTGYDLAYSKATFELSQWLDIGAQLVRPGGIVLGLGTSGADAPDVAAPEPLEPIGTRPYLVADGTSRQVLSFRRR